ncbi:hypothetical protein COI13_05625 [Neisseria meningitidis]|nr:hypothetical protein COI13_05625 [Neisseria meningitidis]
MTYCVISRAVPYFPIVFSHRIFPSYFPVLYMSGRHPHKRRDTDKEKYPSIKNILINQYKSNKQFIVFFSVGV